MSVKSVPAIPRPPAENVAGVLGVCQSTTIAVESDKATIVSVNSYQFNQCDLQFIDFYQNLQRCEATVVSHGSSSNIEFVIHYATVSRGDFLQIEDVNQKSVYFNGYGSSTGVVQSPLKLRWSTGAALRQKGFCLTLKLTNAAPTEALFHEDLISGPVHVESKQLVSIEKQISHGVCARQHATFTLDIDKAAFFSPSSTSVSQCLSLSSLHYDVESENCEVTIKTSGSSFDYSIEYSTKSADNLQISANGLNLGSYHGSGSVSGSFNHREINLAWSSKDAVAAFCLKLIPRK